MATRREWLFGVAGLLIAAPAAAQVSRPAGERKSWQAAGMTLSWAHRDEAVHFEMRAPTRGWLALGFNDKAEMAGTRFLIATFAEGVVRVEVHLAGADGRHASVASGEPSAWLRGVEAWTDERETQLAFVVPHQAGEFAPLSLTPGSRLFAMLAWSVSTDLDHHSRQRENDWLVL
jgi:hypothetical protein